MYSTLQGIHGAERHGAITVLGKGLAGGCIPDLGFGNIRREAFLLPDPVTGSQWPEIRLDCSGKEEIRTVERSFMPRGKFVRIEDCFRDIAAGEIGTMAASSGVWATKNK